MQQRNTGGALAQVVRVAPGAPLAFATGHNVRPTPPAETPVERARRRRREREGTRPVPATDRMPYDEIVKVARAAFGDIIEGHYPETVADALDIAAAYLTCRHRYRHLLDDAALDVFALCEDTAAEARNQRLEWLRLIGSLDAADGLSAEETSERTQIPLDLVTKYRRAARILASISDEDAINPGRRWEQQQQQQRAA